MTHTAIAVDPPPVSNPFVGPEGTVPLILGKGTLNVSHEIVLRNIQRNIRRQIPQLNVYPLNHKPMAIIAGGWSLNETFEDIRELYFDGVPLVALNGAGNWLMERNLRPAMQLVMDSRPDNVVFVESYVPRCKYFLASQCDPSLFDTLLDRGADTHIFHLVSPIDDEEGDEPLSEKDQKTQDGQRLEREAIDVHYGQKWLYVPGGGTIGTRAISLARILGYDRMHVFGMDSCLSPDNHHNHAYEQTWNSPDQKWMDVWCTDRKFRCCNWHMGQAEQFQLFLQACGQHFTLNMHGDGLLSYMLKTGASAARSPEETRDLGTPEPATSET